MRALHLKRADVLGWSMGGMIAQSLAKRHPRLLRRLVLCATAPGDGHGTPPGPDAMRRLSDPSAVGAFGLLFPPGRDELGQGYLRDISAYPQLTPQAPRRSAGSSSGRRRPGSWEMIRRAISPVGYGCRC
jgi:pimeloyl-ACP methyl ester carboxylesterase